MSIRVLHPPLSILGELRHEPVEPRIRAALRGEVAADSIRALLVWEPRRVVPSDAVRGATRTRCPSSPRCAGSSRSGTSAVDVILDGVEAEQPVTAMGEALREELGVESAG